MSQGPDLGACVPTKRRRYEIVPAASVELTEGSKNLIALLHYDDSPHEIIMEITSLLEIKDILNLARTNHTLYRSIQKVKQIVFSINRRLRAYFKDLIAFRSLQAKHDMLISGPFAVMFFARIEYRRKPAMYIYLRGDLAFAELSQHMINQNYALHKNVTYADSSVGRLFQEILEYHRNDRSSVVYVVKCISPPILCLFKFSPTSMEMSVVAWNRALSLLPKASFICKEIYLRSWQSNGARRLMNAWTEFGWKAPRQSRGFYRDRERKGLGNERMVGDGVSWIIDLDCTDIEPSTTPNSVMELSGFFVETGFRPGSSVPPTFEIYAEKFTSPVLRYDYTTSQAGLLYRFAQRLLQLTAIELYRLPKDRRPDAQTMPRLLQRLPADFAKPETWTYRDADLVEWCLWEGAGRIVGIERIRSLSATEQSDGQ